VIIRGELKCPLIVTDGNLCS